jgi:hypothetical protein
MLHRPCTNHEQSCQCAETETEAQLQHHLHRLRHASFAVSMLAASTRESAQLPCWPISQLPGSWTCRSHRGAMITPRRAVWQALPTERDGVSLPA